MSRKTRRIVEIAHGGDAYAFPEIGAGIFCIGVFRALEPGARAAGDRAGLYRPWRRQDGDGQDWHVRFGAYFKV
jgi:hypothetical protein